MKSINIILDNCAEIISKGFQKDSTEYEQLFASVYSVVHTQISEYNEFYSKPIGPCDFLYCMEAIL